MILPGKFHITFFKGNIVRPVTSRTRNTAAPHTHATLLKTASPRKLQHWSIKCLK